MKIKLLFLIFFLTILRSGMAQTQQQIDDFKKQSRVFDNKYYKSNVWDVQRTPANAAAGVNWKLQNFNLPYDGLTDMSIDWGLAGDRYLMFDLVINQSGWYTDDVWRLGKKFNIVLKVYEANGTYVKDISSYGKFMGFGDKGFLFDQQNAYGTFFANDSYTEGGAVTYIPTTGILTKLSELRGYNYSPKLAKPTVSTTTFTYNGTPQGVSIPKNAAYTITGVASAINMGSYTATVALNNKVTHTWSDGTTDDVVIAWSIIKGTYDMTTAKWNYTAPFTYNGSQKSVAVTGLPAGVTVQSYTGNTATNAGSYTASATLSYDDVNYNTPTAIAPISWEIRKAPVNKPTVATTTFTYNSTSQGVTIPENTAYTISGVASATNTGSYTATVALKDKANYQWNDGTTDDVVISWEIRKVTVNKPIVSPTIFTYNSTSQGVSIPANEAYTISGVASATNAGSYTAIVALRDKANYIWNDGISDDITISWSILKASYDMANAKWDYTAPFTYNGSLKSVAVTGLPAGVTAQSYTGNSATNAGSYTASATLSYDDVNYNTPTAIAPISWEISKVTVNKPTVTATTFTYNSTSQGVTIPENTAYTISGVASSTNAGSYTATVALKNKGNYQWSDGTTDDITIDWSIGAIAVVKPTVATTSFTYNSTLQGVSIPKNAAYTITGVASATNVGSYTATVVLNNKVTYKWSDGTTDDVVIAWNIIKGTYDMTTAKWDYTAPFTYNGSQKSVAVTGLPAGVTVQSYTGNTATNAGSYTASATLSYDEVNYNTPTAIAPISWELSKVTVNKPTVSTTTFTYNGNQQGVTIPENTAYTISGVASATSAGSYTATVALKDKANYIWNDGISDDIIIGWSILKASYDMANAKWDYAAPFTYNGSQKSVAVTGLPAGVTVQSYTGNTATNAGSYTASATLSYDDVNYNTPTAIAPISWEISKAPVNKPTVSTTTFTYNSTSQGVTIPENTAYTISGVASATNAGSYNATIALKNKGNYQWNDGTINDITISWSILKASYDMANAKWDYTAPFTYNGSQKSVAVTGLPAGVTVQSYTGNIATNAGSYTASATISYDDVNYNTPTAIAPISWEISKAPVNKPTVATTTFTYNSTSQGVSIPANEAYAITGTTSTVNAGSYTATVALKDKANYQWNDGTTNDVTISWSIDAINVVKPTVTATTFTYNSTSQGVTIPENTTYTISGVASATNTGSYTATVALKDKANYLWNDGTTDDVTISWSINAINVVKPTVTATTFTYNSTLQGVTIPENTAYTISGVASATNAGSYTATVALKDKANYEWNDGTTDDVTISWSILKASYDMANAKWDYASPFTYNGSQKSVALTGLPNGVTVQRYIGNNATNAGSYTASATLSYDDVNHTEPSIQPLVWTIGKAHPTVLANLTNGVTPTFNVTVNGVSSGATPTGSVTLKHGSQELLSKPLSNGGAQLAVNLPQRGTFAITTSYAGNENYLAAEATTTVYSISYNLDGGVLANAVCYFDGSQAIQLPVPQRANHYLFEGWYGNASFSGSPITTIAKGESASYEVYAKWKRHLSNLSIIKLWNNVLAVSNGDKFEEIRNATFRWYKNGTPLSGSQQYLRFDRTIPSGDYKVEIVIDGEAPVVLTYTVAATAAVKAYPNPLMVGNTLIIEMGEERSANEQVQVYNLLGSPVRATVDREATGYRISGLSTSGTYLVRIAKPGEAPTSIKVIVK